MSVLKMKASVSSSLHLSSALSPHSDLFFFLTSLEHVVDRVNYSLTCPLTALAFPSTFCSCTHAHPRSPSPDPSYNGTALRQQRWPRSVKEHHATWQPESTSRQGLRVLLVPYIFLFFVRFPFSCYTFFILLNSLAQRLRLWLYFTDDLASCFSETGRQDLSIELVSPTSVLLS